MTGTMWRVTAALASMMLAVMLLAVGAVWRFDQATAKKAKPVAQIVAAFGSELAYLPDPSNDEKPRLGMWGEVFLLSGEGEFVPADGSLYIKFETEAKGVDGKKLIPEIFHFDATTLASLKTKDERFGDCYAVFLPWPPNWPEKVQLQVSAQFRPTDSNAPQLHTKPQEVMAEKPK